MPFTSTSNTLSIRAIPTVSVGRSLRDAEAVAALERIESVFPAVALHIEQGMFADDAREMLATDNARARQRLEQLRA